MADQAGTLERIAVEIGNTLRPIAQLLGREQLQETFRELGIGFPDQLLHQAGFEAARKTLVAAAERIGPLTKLCSRPSTTRTCPRSSRRPSIWSIFADK